MKIGYFTQTFPYKDLETGDLTKPYIGGGVEMVAYHLARQMAGRGHDISVFTTSIGPETVIEEYPNITVIRYGRRFSIGHSPFSPELMYRPFFSGGHPDIVHAHMGNHPAPLIGYLYSGKKTPFVVTYHGDYSGGFGGPGRRLGVYLQNAFLCKKVLSRADAIIALSEAQSGNSEHLRDFRGKIRHIPNGVAVEDFCTSYSKTECRRRLGLPETNRIILFVGGLTPVKAPDVLMKAMKYVIEEIPDAYLVFVGDGQMKGELVRLCRSSGVESHVRFAGFVTEEEKTHYYNAADIFVLPSVLKSESFGIVLLEASAASLPLVVSDLECFGAIVEEGSNGVRARCGDPADLADRILSLLKNEELREATGKNARKKVDEFAWERVAEMTENVYTEIIGR